MYMQPYLSSLQDLVTHYRTHSLGSSFPGVDTPLKYPFKEMIPDPRRARSTSNPPLPPQPPLSPIAPSSNDRFADVLFNFPAEYPDELSIDVSIDSIQIDCVF